MDELLIRLTEGGDVWLTSQPNGCSELIVNDDGASVTAIVTLRPHEAVQLAATLQEMAGRGRHEWIGTYQGRHDNCPAMKSGPGYAGYTVPGPQPCLWCGEIIDVGGMSQPTDDVPLLADYPDDA